MKIRFLLLALSIMFCVKCKEPEVKKTTSTNQELEEIPQEVMPIEPDGGIGDGTATLQQAFVKNIQRAHQKNNFLAHKAIAFDLSLDFGKDEKMDLRLTMLTNSSKIRLDNADGTTLVYDGEHLYLSPDTATNPNAAFDTFGWAYLFALPYKLSDKGAQFTSAGTRNFNGGNREVYKLTFAPGTGDTSKDSYMIYLNGNGTIDTAGYIMTYGNATPATAAENAKAIVYSDYKEFEGVPIATIWTFYKWSLSNGLSSEPIGTGTLDNFSFPQPGPNFFVKPESSIEIE